MAANEGWTYDRFLLELCQLELVQRKQHRRQKLLSASRLPREKTLAQFERDNEAARASHLDSLETQRKAKQAESDAQIDLELEPEKTRLQNEWLFANPNETAADFEKKAWRHLRANLIEQRKKDAINAEIKSASGVIRYKVKNKTDGILRAVNWRLSPWILRRFCC
ncbi:MAG: hypothetical protein ABI891_03470 [Acidobacteriota bacterium]